MNDDLRELLLEKRTQLESIEQSSQQAAETVELDQTRVGRVSRMDAMAQQAMGKESERRRKLELQRISAALQRLDNDDYGYCQRCGEDIPEPRLQIDPAATLCVNCAR